MKRNARSNGAPQKNNRKPATLPELDTKLQQKAKAIAKQCGRFETLTCDFALFFRLKAMKTTEDNKRRDFYASMADCWDTFSDFLDDAWLEFSSDPHHDYSPRIPSPLVVEFMKVRKTLHSSELGQVIDSGIYPTNHAADYLRRFEWGSKQARELMEESAKAAS